MLFQLLDYVEKIYQVILGITPEQLKSAQNTLKEITPPPINTMLNKQPTIEAVAKRDQRASMQIVDVPPTAGNTFFI